MKLKKFVKLVNANTKDNIELKITKKGNVKIYVEDEKVAMLKPESKNTKYNIHDVIELVLTLDVGM